ncbi:MAG: hypothetical protein KDC44_22315 [Phaeodactylibacter sp.]|nr:hypothetical protein [Phaeodactylibacter sp.]
MNAENFSDYLKSTSELYKVSYQELKSLALQYPYCTNLWILLLKKSHQDGHKDFQKNLEIAAAGSPNRQFLYRQIKQLEAQLVGTDNYLLEEDFLELKTLSELELQSELEDAADHFLKKYQESNATDLPTAPPPTVPVEPPVVADEPEAENLELLDLETVLQNHQPPIEIEPLGSPEEEIPTTEVEAAPRAIEPASPPFEVGYSLILTLAAGVTTARNVHIPQPPAAPTPAPEAKQTDKPSKPSRMPKPMPKSSFSSWLEQFQSPQVILQLDDLMEASRKDLKKKRKKQKADDHWPDTRQARQLAQESIQENEAVASVSLAVLLERQGYHDKAIDMYERLSGIFPEKRAFFARKIEALRKLI